MSKHARDKRPYMKPVTRIELSEDRIKLRLILLIVLLAIAAVAVFVGLRAALTVEPGWQKVQASSGKVNCSTEFTLMYDFSDHSASEATIGSKRLNAFYTTLTEDAYAIFTAAEYETEFANVRYLNDHINEVVTVDPALYQALERIVRYDSRYPFLAPVYEEYDKVFLQTNELDAALYDPAKSPELMDYIRQAAGFANDPEMVRLELLGNGQVCLHVADAYLSFAEEYGLDTFFDFHWMTNAFIIDYMASKLMENGYTNGYLASYDGFNRNLDMRGNLYSHNIYDRQGSDIYLPAVFNYQEPTSIVVLRNYPMSDADRWHYFSYSNGSITTTFVDPADGRPKSATDNLFAYSRESGCVEILLQTAPLFIADELDVDALNGLTEKGIWAIWGEEAQLHTNDGDADLTFVPESGGDLYTLITE